MNEIYLLLLAIVGVFSVGCSIGLLGLGTMIDRYPVGDESKRERSIASPIESTRIAVVLFWALFVIGVWGVIQETRFGLILGITTLFAICLFMFTALAFSFAVLSTMRRRKHKNEVPVLQVGTPDEVIAITQSGGKPSIVARKRYDNQLPDLMLNAMLKKD
jgi:hypothetical protein